MAAERCPKCGKRTGARETRLATHLEEGSDEAHIYSEDGWRCWAPACGHEWGFSVLTEDNTFLAERYGALCDFCGARDPSRSFRSRPFELDTEGPYPQHYSETWAACVECAVLIDSSQRQRLLERAVETLIKLHPDTAKGLPTGRLSRELGRVHDGFWNGMKVVPHGT